MTIDDVRIYCLQKKGAWEDFPFGDDPLVIKVGKKMFALLTNSENQKMSLKCDPFLSLILRKKYTSITPGYHLSKKHWNTIILGDDLSDDLIKKMIDMSYNLVLASLTKSEKNKIIEMVGKC